MVAGANAGESIVLQLKNGDKLTGSIVSENTNAVVIATTWAAELSVPKSAILKREKPSQGAQLAKVSAPAKSTAGEEKSSKAKTPPQKTWKADVKLGADFLTGERDRELYYGKLRLTHEHRYESDPKKLVRSTLDYTAEYGETEGVTSADRMGAGAKTGFDVTERMFLYGLGSGGYDHIRKINERYDFGPGTGYHLFTLPKFTMNVESGMNYQHEDRVDEDVDGVNLRLAQDFTWKIAPRLGLTQSFEYYSRVDDFNQFRTKLDATLSYSLTANLSLNFSVLKLYETDIAKDVSKDEFQIRSSLGVTF
jgi:putative salt-induced outer membrane protein YdiY